MSQKANAQGNAWDNARSNPGDVHKDADVGRIYQDAVQIRACHQLSQTTVAAR